jgi:hypothetical protein
MSNTPNRSADIYYKAKKDLVFKQTKEGPKGRKAAASYRHSTSDSNLSSDKYYRNLEAAPNFQPPQAIKAKPEKVVELKVEPGTSILPKLSSTLVGGATEVILITPEAALQQVRNSIELAVGQQRLTREQADMVSYRVVAAQKVETKVDLEAEEKAEVVKKKRGRKPSNAAVDALPSDLNSELKEKSLDMSEPPSLFNTNAPVTKINIQQDSDE